MNCSTVEVVVPDEGGDVRDLYDRLIGGNRLIRHEDGERITVLGLSVFKG